MHTYAQILQRSWDLKVHRSRSLESVYTFNKLHHLLHATSAAASSPLLPPQPCSALRSSKAAS